MTKCKFIAKNSSFELLVVFSSIFVADTKITFFYNFVAPLIYPIYSSYELLVVFPSIFVADTKITFFYNFVAPLIYPIYSSKLINHDISNVM